MRSLFHPLRCDVYKLENNEFVRLKIIGDPIFRIISTTISNTCIIFRSHFVYGEFSTLNLIEAKFIKQRNHVFLIVRQNQTFVSVGYFIYSFIFGRPKLAQYFFDTISKHVHRQLFIPPRRISNIASQGFPEPKIADISSQAIKGEDMEEESVINHDAENAHANSLVNSSCQDEDQTA